MFNSFEEAMGIQCTYPNGEGVIRNVDDFYLQSVFCSLSESQHLLQ